MRILASLLIAVLVIVLGASASIYAGIYDVAATEPHWPVTTWLLETARTRSIKAHAAAIQVPPGLDDPAKVLVGVDHYAAHCAVCHGGVKSQRAFTPCLPISQRSRRSTLLPSTSGS